MTVTVETLDEAMKFFLSNSDGSVKAYKPDGSFQICNCYPEAEAWYSEQVPNPT